jgi:hypothetical protein
MTIPSLAPEPEEQKIFRFPTGSPNRKKGI